MLDRAKLLAVTNQMWSEVIGVIFSLKQYKLLLNLLVSWLLLSWQTQKPHVEKAEPLIEEARSLGGYKEEKAQAHSKLREQNKQEKFW